MKLKCITFLYCIKDNCIYLFIKQQVEQAVGTKKEKKKRKKRKKKNYKFFSILPVPTTIQRYNILPD